MGLRSLEKCYFFQCGDRLYTSDYDVCRRHILTYKDGPRTERVNMQRGVSDTLESDRCVLTLRTLMSTAVDILCFYYHWYNT